MPSKEASMDLPFDGAISRFYREDAPKAVRKAIVHGIFRHKGCA